MRVRAVAFAALLLARPAVAQTPTEPRRYDPRTPPSPGEPRLLPPIGMGQPVGPSLTVPPSAPFPQAAYEGAQQAEEPRTGPRPDPTVRLPREEKLARIDASTVTVRRLNDTWQLWAGPVLLRDFGNMATDAQDALTAIRGLRPTEWGAIGSPRPVVWYGLTGGKPPEWTLAPRQSFLIDLKTVRAEPVRGAWVVRDDDNIVLNFGTARGEAEQAAMVAKRYGFNRVGLIGSPSPSMAYFFAGPVTQQNRPSANDPFVQLAKSAQEANLTRTAIDVPGMGLIGERLSLDNRLLDVRKDNGEWVLANGPDVLARFGYSELAARDALRVVKDARMTDFCRVGTGMTFFLTFGQPPTRVSFAAERTRFDPTRLVSREVSPGGGWGVFEGTGRMLFPAATRDEAELVIKVVLAYKFDQICQVGTSPKASLRFLAKTWR